MRQHKKKCLNVWKLKEHLHIMCRHPSSLHLYNHIRSFIYLSVQFFGSIWQSEEGVLDDQCLRLFLCFSTWWCQHTPALFQRRAAHAPSTGFSTGEVTGQWRRQGWVLSVDERGGISSITASWGCRAAGSKLWLNGAAGHSYTLQHLSYPWHQISTPGHKWLCMNKYIILISTKAYL